MLGLGESSKDQDGSGLNAKPEASKQQFTNQWATSQSVWVYEYLNSVHWTSDRTTKCELYQSIPEHAAA